MTLEVKITSIRDSIAFGEIVNTKGCKGTVEFELITGLNKLLDGTQVTVGDILLFDLDVT